MNPSLLLLADGRFPAGGHTNSAGIEAAMALGDAGDEAALETYLRGRLATTGVVDAAFAARTTGIVDDTRPVESAALRRSIDELVEEYDARVLSPHLRDISRTFGRQLLRAGRTAWSHPVLDELHQRPRTAHQPIVLGALVAAVGESAHAAAALTFHQLASAVTTAAVRLRGFDPIELAAMQARAAAFVEPYIARAPQWAVAEPSTLPSDGGALTEILGDDHARWDARLFVA